MLPNESVLFADYEPELQAAETLLRLNLRTIGYVVKACYSPEEVCRIIGCSMRTLKRMLAAYEPPEIPQRDPIGMRSIMYAKNRVVAFADLVDWLQRNQTYEREVAP